MVKETQGLQIALIVFVILTIGLGVSTFMLYKKTEELTLKTKQATDDSAAAKKNCDLVQADKNTLMKDMLGFLPSEKMDAITADFNKDMETYASTLDAATRNYRRVLAYLNDELGKKNVALAEQLKSVQELKDTLARVEIVKQPQIDEAQAGQKAAIADLASEREKFNTDRGAFTGKTTTIEDTLVKTQKGADLVSKEAQLKLKKAEELLASTVKNEQLKNEQVKKLTATTFESPSGKIRWVNQRERTVWINLGAPTRCPGSSPLPSSRATPRT